MKCLFSLVSLMVFICLFLFSSKSLATSWAYSFVVWKDDIYVISDEYVSDIKMEIGHVTKYSDMDSYPGNFSNTFKEGTKYFSIKGISTKEAIAVKEPDGRYIKAYQNGEYKVRSAFDGFFNGQQGVIKISVLFIIGAIAAAVIYKVKSTNSNNSST
ncbi:hypothetical protein [Metabacillus indicus]|uniref:hypothetical protein n=1 Tax=Metabacillus indicus TaxID=246786 RepID=UPI00068BBFCE|nr:hypothetical protein [Metabacillus indicus]